MKKILALAGSNSSKSINFTLINYIAPLIENENVEVLDIRKWDIPIYSENMDSDNFTPDPIKELIEIIKKHDAYIISVPEHNAGPTVFFKNITDWLSRRSENVMEDKPVFLLSTSPGRKGAEMSRAYTELTLPRLGGKVVSTFSLPSFNHTMINGKLVKEEQDKLENALDIFLKAL